MKAGFDSQKNYYAILGISEDSDEQTIKQAYRQLARRYHPDSGSGDLEAFRLVQEAYDILRMPSLRQAYDRHLLSREQKADGPLEFQVLLNRQELKALSASQMVYLLVDIASKTSQPGTRLPLNLALVLDRSTSMRGIRMENVKMAALDLLDSLQDDDRLAVVIFSDRAEVIVPPTVLRDRRPLRSAIAGILPDGGTEILQGLQLGLAQVRKHLDARSINHVILLTDGRTYGDEDQCLMEARRASAEGVGISAMGIGEDWNDLFLDSLARNGNGVSQYINAPTQLRQFLRNQVEGLGSAVAREVLLTINPAAEVKVTSVYRVLPYLEYLPLTPGEVLRLGNLGQEPMALMFDLVVRAAEPGLKRLLRLELTADMQQERTHISLGRDIALVVSGEGPAPEVAAEGPPPRLLNLLSKLSVYRLQEQAWQALESGDAKQATRLLESAATRLFDLGYRDLAQAALLEAGQISRGGTVTMQGRKKLRYGTRSLTLMPKSSREDVV